MTRAPTIAIAALTTGCADYDGGPLYRLTPPSDGWPTVVEVEPDELYRFRLDVPPGTRGFAIYTEAPFDQMTGVAVAEQARAAVRARGSVCAACASRLILARGLKYRP